MSNYAYSSPGVTVSEVLSPTVAPFIAGPSVLAIVGSTQGFQSATESITLNGLTPYTFRFTGLDTQSVSVRDLASGSSIGAGNYLVTQSSNPDGINNSGDEVFTIQRAAVPATAPTVATDNTGALSGTYVYAVSFINPGGETTIGPQSAQVTVNGSQSVDLSNVPVDTSGSNTATARNIYRAKVTNGVAGSFHLVATIADNTTTSLTAENTSDAAADAAVTPNTGIVDGGQVVVSYQYTNVGYYQPQLFSDFATLQNTYGTPYDSATGTITSELSFAAMLAFQNGASEVLAVAALSDGDTDLENAIQQLDNQDISLITVVSGSSNVHSALVAHVNSLNSQGLYRMAIMGNDGTATNYAATDLQNIAKGINDESIVFVSPATFTIQNPVDSTKSYNIGGQYVAAAVGGMFAGRDVQVPLTRKFLSGFSGIADSRTRTQQVQDSQAGLLEIVQVGGPNGPLQIRHGVTTAAQSITTAEASVIRAKHEMARRLKVSLDGAVVGQVIPVNEVQAIISSMVSGILEQMVAEQAIQGYSGVGVVIPPNTPTACTVSFSYLPSFPMNNISVSFTIDTNTGDFTGG